MNTIEISETELVSGTILYDRYGEADKHKAKASTVLRPFPNALRIINIEDLRKKSTNKKHV